MRLIVYERNLILDTLLRARLDLDKHYSELSPDAESAFAMRDLIDESASLQLIDRYETRLMRNIAINTRLLAEAQRNRPPVEDGPTPALEPQPGADPADSIPQNHVESVAYVPAEPQNETAQNEPNPTTGHPALTPIGGATRPGTIQLRRPGLVTLARGTSTPNQSQPVSAEVARATCPALAAAAAARPGLVTLARGTSTSNQSQPVSADVARATCPAPAIAAAARPGLVTLARGSSMPNQSQPVSAEVAIAAAALAAAAGQPLVPLAEPADLTSGTV